MPEGAIYVGRGSLWGNPYPLVNGRTPEIAVGDFASYLLYQPRLVAAAREVLRGHDLACWCPLDKPCHADVWLRTVNQ